MQRLTAKMPANTKSLFNRVATVFGVDISSHSGRILRRYCGQSLPPPRRPSGRLPATLAAAGGVCRPGRARRASPARAVWSNMARLLPVLTFWLTLLTAVQVSEPLTCYACLPDGDLNLSLPFKLVMRKFPLCSTFNWRRPGDQFIMKCPSITNACIKTRTFRSCFFSRHEGCEPNGRCTCKTDLCNGATAERAPATAAVAAVAGVTVLMTLLRQCWT